MGRQKTKTAAVAVLMAVLTVLADGNDGSSSSSRIKTVVILIMENRSFDHMLGFMKAHNPGINGLTGNESNPLSTGDPSSPLIPVNNDAEYVDPDPGHSFDAVKEQIFGAADADTSSAGLANADTAGAGARVPRMNGFAQNAARISANMSEEVMRAFSPAALPVYSALAQEFAVFDRWFSSLPGPTQPNRLFAYSATSHGTVSHDRGQMARGFPQRTVFQSLHESGVPFGIYYEAVPTTLLFRELRKLKYVSKFHAFHEFGRDARAGGLPAVTVLEPRYFHAAGGSPANDDHPSHDVANGQRLVKYVYEELRASPQWNGSLLVITYDEHGGFFDHVATPVSGVPSPDGIVSSPPQSFKFDRLGVRVPCIMVSPWIDKATVVHGPRGPTETSEYEHSSIPATLKKIFNLSSDFLTNRDAWAGTFDDVFMHRDSPRTDCPEVLPEVPQKPAGTERGNEDAPVTEFQSELVELAAVLNGDHLLSTFPLETARNMRARDARRYVKNAVARFMEASRHAIELGANESVIVDMKPSVTTRNVGFVP